VQVALQERVSENAQYSARKIYVDMRIRYLSSSGGYFALDAEAASQADVFVFPQGDW
jgi:outer membrane protein assembly factor BamB